MSTRSSFETILAALRSARFNTRHFGTMLFWGCVLLFAIVTVFIVMTWRVRVNNQSVSTKLLEAAKSMPPAAISHSAATIDANANSNLPPSAPSSSLPLSQAKVSVNGQSVPLPASGNGEVHKVVTSDDGTAKVNVTVRSDSTSNSSTNSSFTLNVQSSTDSSTGQSP